MASAIKMEDGSVSLVLTAREASGVLGILESTNSEEGDYTAYEELMDGVMEELGKAGVNSNGFEAGGVDLYRLPEERDE